MDEVADRLGWDYVYEPMQIISRFPIITPGSDSDFVYVEVAPDRVVAVSNVHLQAFPYGPYDLRDGATVDQVLTNETQIHMQQMASRFASLPALVDHIETSRAGTLPVRLAGAPWQVGPTVRARRLGRGPASRRRP